MSQKKQTAFKFAIILLSIIGFIVSYILVLRSEGYALASSVCNVNSAFDCNKVTNSSWSKIFGFSLATLGSIYYLFLIIWTAVSVKLESVSKVWSKTIVVLSIFSVLFSLYLLGVSHFLIKALCPFCIALYAVNFFIFFFSLMVVKGEFFRDTLSGLKYFIMSPLSLFSSKTDNSIFVMFFSLIGSIFLAFISPDFYQGSRGIEENASFSWSSRGKLIDSVVETGVLKDYFKGGLDSAIEIVEFSDIECPFCRRAYFQINELIKDYGSDVRVVFKNYPLDKSCNAFMEHNVHQNACLAAEFSRCAGEQGLFWESLDFLMASEEVMGQATKQEMEKTLISSFTQGDLDVEAMQLCLDSDRQLAKIKEDTNFGESIGVVSTPSIFINSRKVKGPTPEKIKKILDYLVERK